MQSAAHALNLCVVAVYSAQLVKNIDRNMYTFTKTSIGIRENNKIW